MLVGNFCDVVNLRNSTVSWVYNGSYTIVDIHGHRTVKAPHPVRSAQLNTVPPS
jgi:hypothetical protein